MSNDIVVRIRAEAADLKAGLDDAANAIRSRAADMGAAFAGVASQAADAGARVATDFFDRVYEKSMERASDGVVDFGSSLVHLGEDAAIAGGGVIATRAAVASLAPAVAGVAAPAAAAAAAIWLTFQAANGVAATSAAIAGWVADVSGAATVGRLFSDEGTRMAAAQRQLTLQFGDQAQAFTHVAQIAADYGVSVGAAGDAVIRMVAVLDPANASTAQGRQILADYGVTSTDAATALDQFAQALTRVRDGTAKTADVQAVLGQTGTQWLKGVADGAGSVSHAFTEADRIMAATAADIEASKQRIATAPHVSWLGEMSDRIDGVGQRFSALTTRSDEFKAEQSHALAEIATAWAEYTADVASTSEAWTRAKVGFLDYAAVVLQHAPALKEALGLGTWQVSVPQAPPDSRTAPPPHKTGAQGKSGASGDSAALAGYQQELAQKLLLKENWLRQDHALDVQFWQAKISEEQSEGLQETSSLMGLLTQRLAQAEKAQAQWQKQQSDASTRTAQQDAAQQLAVAQTTAASRAKIAEIGVDGEIEDIQRRRAADQVTAVEEAQDLAAANARKRAIELAAAEEHLALVKSSAAADAQTVAQAQAQVTQIVAANALAQQKDLDAVAAAQRADQKALAKDNADTAKALSAQRLADEKSVLDTEVSLGQISADQKLDTLRAMAAQEAAIDQQAQAAKRDLYAQGSAEWQKAENAMVVAKAKADSQISALDRQAAVAAAQSWQSTLSPITQSFDSMLQGMGQGTQNFQQVEDNALRNVVMSFVNSRIKIEADWLAGQASMAFGAQTWANKSLLSWVSSSLGITAAEKVQGAQQVADVASTETAKTSAVVAEAAARNAAEQSAQSTSLVGMAEQAVKAIANDASTTFAGVFAFLSPEMGPAAAGPAAAASAAVASAAGSIASAAGGWDSVPYDGAMARLHFEEMVLPRDIANPLRQSLAAGSWGMPQLGLDTGGGGSGASPPPGGAASGSATETPAWATQMVSMLSKVLSQPRSMTIQAVDAASLNNLMQRQSTQPGLALAINKLNANGVPLTKG